MSIRKSDKLGILKLNPYGFPNTNYYFVLVDLPILPDNAVPVFSQGTPNQAGDTITYTFEDITVDDSTKKMTYNVPVFLEQTFVNNEGETVTINVTKIEVKGKVNGKEKKISGDTSTIKMGVKPTLPPGSHHKIHNVRMPSGSNMDFSSTCPLPEYYIRTSFIRSETFPNCLFLIAVACVDASYMPLLGLATSADNSAILQASVTDNPNGEAGQYITAVNMIPYTEGVYTQIQFDTDNPYNLFPASL